MSSQRKIGVITSTAISITIVVGAGLLTLPGLTYEKAGIFGYIPWVVVSLAIIPLLEIFSYFAKKHPTAGGVIGYARISLGDNIANMCEMIIIGTFTLGIPAIAIIGSTYLQQSFQFFTPAASSFFIVTIAFLAGVAGIKISGRIQIGIAAAIIIGLISISVGFIASSYQPAKSLLPLPGTQQDIANIIGAIPLVLFAFTGWEMTAFLAEDMENPKKNLPISIWSSYIMVSILYIFIAWAISAYADNSSLWRVAPVARMAELWVGSSGAKVISVLAALLVVANVIAAFISASRSVFSAGREGLLPEIIGKTGKNGEPLIAMMMTWFVFSMVIGLFAVGLFDVGDLLQLAGQNFFILYLVAVIGYLKINRRPEKFFYGTSGLIVSCGMMFLFSMKGVMYCLFLACLGYIIGLVKEKFNYSKKSHSAN